MRQIRDTQLPSSPTMQIVQTDTHVSVTFKISPGVFLVTDGR